MRKDKPNITYYFTKSIYQTRKKRVIYAHSTQKQIIRNNLPYQKTLYKEISS